MALSAEQYFSVQMAMLNIGRQVRELPIEEFINTLNDSREALDPSTEENKILLETLNRLAGLATSIYLLQQDYHKCQEFAHACAANGK
jgi:hypothetical protein